MRDNFLPRFPFWLEEGGGGGARRKRKKKKIPVDVLPSIHFSSPRLSLGVKSSGGGQGCSVGGAHVIQLGEYSKQAACAESLPARPLTL